MTVIYPPNPIHIPQHCKSIFLAGSIEMGLAEDWQSEIIECFGTAESIYFLNPRRKDWDSAWEQNIENAQFKEQVSWELEGLEKADKVVFYFAPQTKAPISLLELGLQARSEKAIVCCPKGYWRKGNVDIVCERFGIKQVQSLKDLVSELDVFLKA